MSIDTLEEMRQRLRSVERITFSSHFLGDVLPYRERIDTEAVRNRLRDPRDLIACEHQEDPHPGEKYALYFRESERYDMKIVVSFLNERLNVVTAHIQDRHRRPGD